MTADTKIEMHRVLVRRVLTKVDNISSKEFKEREGVAAFEWINNNQIEIDPNSNALKNGKGFINYRDSILNEKDKINFDNFIRKRTFEYIFDYPLEFTKQALKGAVHAPLLNPFHIFSEL